MSDSTIVAIVTGLPATIAACGSFIVALRNGRKANEAKAEALIAVGKAESLAAGQEEIHKIVNSNLSVMKADLDHARGEITALREILTVYSQRETKENS